MNSGRAKGSALSARCELRAGIRLASPPLSCATGRAELKPAEGEVQTETFCNTETSVNEALRAIEVGSIISSKRDSGRVGRKSNKVLEVADFRARG